MVSTMLARMTVTTPEKVTVGSNQESIPKLSAVMTMDLIISVFQYTTKYCGSTICSISGEHFLLSLGFEHVSQA